MHRTYIKHTVQGCKNCKSVCEKLKMCPNYINIAHIIHHFAANDELSWDQCSIVKNNNVMMLKIAHFCPKLPSNSNENSQSDPTDKTMLSIPNVNAAPKTTL